MGERRQMPVYQRKDTQSKRYFYKFDVDSVTYKRNIPTARTRRQAEEAERQARDDVHAGRYGKKKDMLFTEFVEKHYRPWSEQHHKNQVGDKTISDLLCRYFPNLPLSRLSRFSVETFKLTLAKTKTKYGNFYMPNTVNLTLAYLSIIMNLAVEYGFIRDNPVRKVKRLPVEEKRPRHLSAEEEELLLAECGRDRDFLKALVQMAIWTGFRRGELLGLQVQHVDFTRNLIFAPHAKWKRDKRKTEGNPMSQKVRDLAMELCSQTSNYLFIYEGKPVAKRIADKWFRRACRNAGIYDLTFHALRHTFGTRLGEKDVNLKKIARLMGHATTKHTEIYVHTTDAGLISAMEIAALPYSKRASLPEMKVVNSA
jgi:integrase